MTRQSTSQVVSKSKNVKIAARVLDVVKRFPPRKIESPQTWQRYSPVPRESVYFPEEQFTENIFQFLIVLVRGQLIWQPSGLRENFIIIRSKDDGYQRLHWLTTVHHAALYRVLSWNHITPLLKDKYIKYTRTYKKDLDYFGVTYATNGRLIINMKGLEKHPQCNEIIAQAAIM